MAAALAPAWTAPDAEALAYGAPRRSVRRARPARRPRPARHPRLPARRAGGRGAASRRPRAARQARAGAGADGLFEAPCPTRAPYLLRIHWPGAVQETEDPYSFGPLLGELDLHLFAEGRHFELAEALGRPRHDGRRRHGRALRGLGAQRRARRRGRRLQRLGCAAPSDAPALPSGVWELFVPRVWPGARYKYEIVGADGVRCR